MADADAHDFRSLPTILPSRVQPHKEKRLRSPIEGVPLRQENRSSSGYGVSAGLMRAQRHTPDPDFSSSQDNAPATTPHVSLEDKQTADYSRPNRENSPVTPSIEKTSDKVERDPVASDASTTAPVPKPRSLLSSAQQTNVRYQRDGSPPRQDHPNEDGIVIEHVDNTMRMLAVLDGHDGGNAVRFAVQYLKHHGLSDLLIGLTSSDCDTDRLFPNLFEKMDHAFFASIKRYTGRKRIIQDLIKNCKSSYDAYLQYPSEISELQELEELISGGTTVVLAVIINDKVHVANVGDSRALIVRELSDGTLDIEQLSTDHGVDNENELDRLAAICLNREQLRKSGRVGSQENTRSIGDYCLKGGYQDVDALSEAIDQPGTSIPSVNSVDIDKSFKYLLLMSDGVYKSIESLDYPPVPAKTGKTICDMLKVAVTNNPRDFQKVAEDILEKIAVAHQRTHYGSDPQSPLAVQCRKRDDMSLVVYQFKQV